MLYLGWCVGFLVCVVVIGIGVFDVMILLILLMWFFYYGL